MSYTKTTWINGTTPAISAANLNNLETQYDEALLARPVPTSGTYAGDSSADKAIAHGLGVVPQLIYIVNGGGAHAYFIFPSLGFVTSLLSSPGTKVCTVPDATNFYVGDAADYAMSANLNANTYYWIAIP